jgi:hypothetical protein
LAREGEEVFLFFKKENSHLVLNTMNQADLKLRKWRELGSEELTQEEWKYVERFHAGNGWLRSFLQPGMWLHVSGPGGACDRGIVRETLAQLEGLPMTREEYCILLSSYVGKTTRPPETELMELVGPGVDAKMSLCGAFIRGALRVAGCDHPRVTGRYNMNPGAISDITTAAESCNALYPVTRSMVDYHLDPGNWIRVGGGDGGGPEHVFSFMTPLWVWYPVCHFELEGVTLTVNGRPFWIFESVDSGVRVSDGSGYETVIVRRRAWTDEGGVMWDRELENLDSDKKTFRWGDPRRVHEVVDISKLISG